MSSAERCPDPAPATLDQRLARLEAIVVELESGGGALETAIERYQEGVELLKDCRAVLAGYRKRVEELSQSAEESLRAYAHDPDATDSDAASRTTNPSAMPRKARS